MDFLHNLSMKEKLLLLVLGVALIVFLGVSFLILPASSALGDDNATLSTAQLNAASATLEVAQAKAAPAKVKAAYEVATKSAAAMLPTINKPSLHLWLLGLAQNSGLKLNSITLSDPIAFVAPATTSSSTSSGTSSATSSSTSSATSSATSSTTSSSSSAVSGSTGTSSATATTDYVTMSTVTMELIGSYSQTNKFLDQIKNTKRDVMIISYTCTKANNICTCDVTLECFAAEKFDNSDHLFRWTKPKPAGKSAMMQ